MATRLTIEEAAKHLKIGKPTLYPMARDGKIPARKVGRAWRFNREALDQWIQEGHSENAKNESR